MDFIDEHKITCVAKRVGDDLVVITEIFDPFSVIRKIEPQSGSHVIVFTKYQVTIISRQKTERIKELFTMEQIYEKYPWFFELAKKDYC